eukprot:CAMPEP_0194202854 /NCGR_PEP_ID=MMETSP0156-20130528/2775_1 /TAXON_ID=33649 /ORGANISM="Thalassionema nitzschioides, Strain L26-B" /LENGTH=1887 /DNA_ID=CAMNT_0038928459 /DNA_START=174 /DNA_END=5837 /DNA_ORIENTATION=-
MQQQQEEDNNDQQQKKIQHPLSSVPLPPPPSPMVMDSRKAATSSNVTTATHETNPAVPTLKSAPPSGNFDVLTSSTTSGDLPPPPVFSKASGTSTVTTGGGGAVTSDVLPPPPVLSALVPVPNNKNEGSSSRSATKTTTTATKEEEPSSSSSPPSLLEEKEDPSTTTTPAIQLERPLPLPLTTFAPKSHSFLAKRQSHLPILVIATESAHRMAWKNKLRLVDLIEGLAQDLSSVSSGHPLAPFRSLSRSMLLNWDDDLKLAFYDASNDYDNPQKEKTQELLQSHAALKASDGNLAEELDLLEGQVDQLLLQDMKTYNTNSSGIAASSSSSGGEDEKTNSNKNQYQTLMEANRQRQQKYDQVVKDAFALTSPPNIPWLWRFRMALDESTQFLEATGDYMSQPAVCLLVCSTHDYAASSGSGISGLEQLDACINDLAHPHNLRKRFYGGLSLCWGATALKREVVVLHDAVEGPKDDVVDLEWLELQLQQKYQGTKVLSINSIVPSMAAALEEEETSDLWHGQGKRGNCLSVSDRLNVRRYLAQLVASSLLPAMERRIADLNVIVTEKKKGVRNVFRGIFGGGSKSSTTSTVGKLLSVDSSNNATSPNNAAKDQTGSSKIQHPSYRFDSIESYTRLLADSLFLMKDYEAAYSIYKLIKDDYKNDRAMLQYASVQEHMALCLYGILKQAEKGSTGQYYNPSHTMKEMFGFLETALFHYTRVAEEDRASSSSSPARPTTAPAATRLATRLCLVLSSCFVVTPSSSSTTETNSTAQSTIDRHLEVADLLASASSHETSLGAAVLLEQSSAHYYKACMYRKYAFHMLMSGHMFRSAHQEHHAFRCFTSALYIYQHDGQWKELHNHLRSALAAQLYSLDRMAISVELYAKLVGTTGGGRVSVKSQQKFLHHLVEICEHHSKKALVGADRMATQSLRKRQARMQHIVSIIRHSKPYTSKRVLEIPNMDLPQIQDSSIQVEVEAEADKRNSSSSTISNHALLGKWKEGDSEIWNELECLTIAELRACDEKKKGATISLEQSSSTGGVPSSSSSGTDQHQADAEDLSTRRIFNEWDQEKAHHRFTARLQKSSTYKGEKPAVRAINEPLVVQVTMKNPLAITVELHHVQLVARLVRRKEEMTEEEECVCTNEDAIAMADPSAKSNDDTADDTTATVPKEWTFPGSSQTFVQPDFMLLSTTTNNSSSSSATAATTTKWKSGSPYFVVTRQTQVLSSCNSTTMSLHICPLVQGDLEILGLRCKLSNKVWSYHPFHLQGPLLQNTQHHRATRARAPPVLLKSNVQAGMPRLKATWEHTNSRSGLDDNNNRSNSSWLPGEVTHWTLRLENMGTAPCQSVTLKTDVPWIHVLQQQQQDSAADDDDPELIGTSSCIGPSGTLLALRFGGGDDNNILLPGQVVNIPFTMRASTNTEAKATTTKWNKRKQDLYFLFRYEFETTTTASSSKKKKKKNQHRWLRQMCTVSMAPSLTLSASVMPSYWERTEHILSVEITNTNPQTSFILDKLALASRDYRLQPINTTTTIEDDTTATNDNSDATTTGDNNDEHLLQAFERSTMHYRLIPTMTTTSSNNSNNKKKCMLSECPFDGSSSSTTSRQECTTSDCMEYVCLERAHNNFTTAFDTYNTMMSGDGDAGEQPRHVSQIRRDNANDDTATDGDAKVNHGHPTSIAQLFPTQFSLTRVDLICTWRKQQYQNYNSSNTTNTTTTTMMTAADDNHPMIDATTPTMTTTGQHHLFHVPVRPLTSSAAGCPLTLTCRHPSQVTHDFSNSTHYTPARVPMEITIRNRLVPSSTGKNNNNDDALEFEFSLEETADDDVTFQGSQQYSSNQLAGGDDVTVCMQAFVHRPGVVNLQRVRLTIVEKHSKKRTPYLFPLQWMVQVDDAAN